MRSPRRWDVMAQFLIRFAGRERDSLSVDCADVGEARSMAVQQLGGYLLDNPGFAEAGHWRVEVEDDVGRIVATVIVATVSPRHLATPA